MYASYCKLLVKCCNRWYVVLNHVRSWFDIGCLKSFEISLDYQSYMGSSAGI
jgi:hypothetical protein